MKEIGGYFELELNYTKEYYQDAIKLNSGRNALFYILKTNNPSKIYIPYYICHSVLEPIKKLNIDFCFYHINKKFEPILPSDYSEANFLLYVNYFGINFFNVKKLSNKIKNLIIDNSQAFFYRPIKNPTFYSTRKFFGVPDGAYLYNDLLVNEALRQSMSYDKCIHLLKRFDLESIEGYRDYEKIEAGFSSEPIMLMSKLTQKILTSIPYEKIKLLREQNFLYLHDHLKDINELYINTNNLHGPMKYPLLIKKDGLKQNLIKNKIYVSTYWQEVIETVENNTFEYELTKYLLPLPIDQRYNQADMELIIEKINEAIIH